MEAKRIAANIRERKKEINREVLYPANPQPITSRGIEPKGVSISRGERVRLELSKRAYLLKKEGLAAVIGRTETLGGFAHQIGR